MKKEILLKICYVVILVWLFLDNIECLEKVNSIPVMEPPVCTNSVNDLTMMDPKIKAYLYVSFLIISVYIFSKFF